jgi:hypothetical protein
MSKQAKIACPVCGKKCGGQQGVDAHMSDVRQEVEFAPESETKPDWKHSCCVCGQRPIVPLTGMCGPCTFGEAETMGGNW